MAELDGETLPAAPGASELPGGTVVWLFVAIELLTFGLFFVAFAWARSRDPGVFDSSQKALHVTTGAINTLVLLTGSYFAALAVQWNRRSHPRRVAGWMAAAAASGVVFMGIKATEYADVFGAGISLSTNGFWFFYLFLTFLHFVHVAGGVGLLLAIGWRALRGAYGSASPTVEAVAIYWHMVDLIWIVLFPLLYLVHT